MRPAAWKLLTVAFQALCAGEEPGVADVAARVELSPSEGTQLLQAMAGVGVVELEGERVTAAAGLTVTPTRHTLVLDGLALPHLVLHRRRGHLPPWAQTP